MRTILLLIAFALPSVALAQTPAFYITPSVTASLGMYPMFTTFEHPRALVRNASGHFEVTFGCTVAFHAMTDTAVVFDCQCEDPIHGHTVCWREVYWVDSGLLSYVRTIDSTWVPANDAHPVWPLNSDGVRE